MDRLYYELNTLKMQILDYQQQLENSSLNQNLHDFISLYDNHLQLSRSFDEKTDTKQIKGIEKKILSKKIKKQKQNLMSLFYSTKSMYPNLHFDLENKIDPTKKRTLLKKLSSTLAHFLRIFFIFANEFKAIIKAASLIPFGYKKDFLFYGLNPKVLTKEQSTYPAILLLHPFRSNQALFLGLAKFLQYKIPNPIYTVNLSYLSSKEDLTKLKQAILSIKKQYLKYYETPRIILVGHSRGAIEAAHYLYCLDENEQVSHTTIDSMISIAGRLKPSSVIPDVLNRNFYTKIQTIYSGILKKENKAPLLSLVCDRDWKLPMESAYLEEDLAESKMIKYSSHLSIVFSEKTYQKIEDWIKKRNSLESKTR